MTIKSIATIYKDAKDTHWDKNPLALDIETVTVNKKSNPILNQLDNFLNVIRENDKPLVSGLEGLKTSAVIDAIKRATKTGKIERPWF